MKPIIIRAGQGTLGFMIPEADGTTTYHPYAVKSGMSIAANLRQAFKEESYLVNGAKKAVLMVASPVMLMPTAEYEEYEQFDADEMYGNVITGHKGEEKIIKQIDELDVTAVFPVNSDLQMVVNDHFPIVDTQNVMTNVWPYLYKKYYESGKRRKLFAYFHDKMVDICNFEQHRIHFANSFQATHAHDALYYIMYIWKQLGMNQMEDELHIMGDMPHGDWLEKRLKTYVNNVIIKGNGLREAPEHQLERKNDNGNKTPFDLTICE